MKLIKYSIISLLLLSCYEEKEPNQLEQTVAGMIKGDWNVKVVKSPFFYDSLEYGELMMTFGDSLIVKNYYENYDISFFEKGVSSYSFELSVACWSTFPDDCDDTNKVNLIHIDNGSHIRIHTLYIYEDWIEFGTEYVDGANFVLVKD